MLKLAQVHNIGALSVDQCYKMEPFLKAYFLQSENEINFFLCEFLSESF